VDLKVFNTLTRSKETFEPLEPDHVRMYVCGVTVYDRCHIGHARAYVAFDVIQRYLRWRGYQVTYVRNFTDVDDKIIRRAGERGEDVRVLTDRYIAAFQEDMEALGVARADIEPRVTDHIPDIIAAVQAIVDRGHAYVVGGDVYYDITSFPGYLRLSGRRLDEMMEGASGRVDPAERDKRHPLDFALWKAARPGEPAWDSPWGPGRPGWHIECSTMSRKYLGDCFDLHGGGADLIFPHHENERAQSWALTGAEFVRHWLHNGFVNVDSEKMSKSLGNFFTIQDVIARFHPEALRYFLLTTHYRSPINFNDGAVQEAEGRVEYLYETVLAARDFLARSPADPDPSLREEAVRRIREAMDDDFNTAMALAVVADVARELNDVLTRKGKMPDRGAKVAGGLAALGEVGRVLGLAERDPMGVLGAIRDRRLARRGLDRGAIEDLVARRSQARADRDFALADALRQRLLEMGVQVMDGPEGTRWKVL